MAITGGVGGAKLVSGLQQVLPPEELVCLVNTGDDFRHLGLHVSPDLDSLMYALSGENNRTSGWGRRDETWQFLEALRQYGGEDWFALGDRDLATHVWRTELLRRGHSLTEVTAILCRALGIAVRILPMSDDPVHTMVRTAHGELPFQHYFVRERCRPEVIGFRFEGAAQARCNPALQGCLQGRFGGIVVCPSNPYVSIDPILALPGMLEMLKRTRAPVIAVSPIIAGEAVKGPAAKMMRELGMEAGPLAVMAHYGELLSGFILDRRDAGVLGKWSGSGLKVVTAQTLMTDAGQEKSLAEAVLALLGELGGRRPG